MTTEPDLLPLRDWMECLGEINAEDIRDYARANVAHAVAPLQAEIEALRAEVERANGWNERVSVCLDHVAEIVDGPCVICALDAAEARADKLAEALALLPDEIAMVEHNPDDGPLMFCCGREVNDLGPRGLLITHDGGCWYARMRALRDHDQEDRNHRPGAREGWRGGGRWVR